MNHTTYTNRVFKLAAVPLALLVGACSSIQPVPLAPPNLAIETKADAEDIRKDVEPIVGALSLDEAIARALKYNLERRTRMMEEALALNQLDVSKYDMLPKFMAQAGYAWRNNDRISLSRNSTNGDLSPSTFVSQDRTHMMNELGFSWNLLDFGLGYYGARQAADRVLVAAEKRRKAMHLLMQDVRTSYWRAASAQKLRSEVEKTVVMAEAALEDARKVEASRVRNPLDSLRYQRQLQENLRLLEGIDKELASAQVELASLINAPIGQPFQIAEAARRISLQCYKFHCSGWKSQHWPTTPTCASSTTTSALRLRRCVAPCSSSTPTCRSTTPSNTTPTATWSTAIGRSLAFRCHSIFSIC